MTAQTLKLAEIITDAGTQTRCHPCEETISEYADAWLEGAKFPPVTVFHDGTAHYLADGFHRVLSALRVGLKDIPAIVHKGTVKEAIWCAIGANRENGLRRQGGDKRKAVIIALREFPGKSGSEIAKQIGVSQPYVSQIKGECITSNTLQLPERITRSNGVSYPATLPQRKPEPVTPADVLNGPEIKTLPPEPVKGLDPFEDDAPKIVPMVDAFSQRRKYLSEAIDAFSKDFPQRTDQICNWLLNKATELKERAAA